MKMSGNFFVDPSAIDQGHYETRLASPVHGGFVNSASQSTADSWNKTDTAKAKQLDL